MTKTTFRYQIPSAIGAIVSRASIPRQVHSIINGVDTNN